jgi:hypothetical protein
MNIKNCLQNIKGQSHAAPPFEYAIGAWNDFLLDVGLLPLNKVQWRTLEFTSEMSKSEKLLYQKRNYPENSFRQQVEILALWWRELGLFQEVIEKSKNKPLTKSSELFMETFFKLIRGVPIDLIHKTTFRQEEVLRQWAITFDLQIEGETSQKSALIIKSLNYLNAIKEAESAENLLKDELQYRERIIQELRAKADFNRGSYE